MKKGAMHFAPKRKDTIVRQLSDEFIVYDKETNHAHCLNQIAADVWRLCDGKKTVAEITRSMEKAKPPVEEGLVWMTLRKLSKAGLLLEPIPLPPPSIDLSRREVMRRVGMTAMVTLPLVTSMLVPTAAEAASCATIGQLCNTKPCCAPLTCVANHCV